MKKSLFPVMSRSALALGVVLAVASVLPASALAQTRAAAGSNNAGVIPAATEADSHPTRAFWKESRGVPAARSASGSRVSVRASRVRTVTLDQPSLARLLQAAPAERSSAARQSPLVMVLPDPAGRFQRFSVVDSPIMEPGLAARHPDIKTYAGRGIDDPGASLRMSVTPLGVQASVRSAKGGWYVEPYYQLDQSVYASFYRADAQRGISSFSEDLMREAQVLLSRGRYHADNDVLVEGLGFVPNGTVTITVRLGGQAVARQTIYTTASENGTVSASFKADPRRALGSYEVTVSDGRSSSTSSYRVVADNSPLAASVGSQLRTYRLALLSDPGYANYFGGSANVTAAKVALINRVTQIYEDETSIRLVLIANNDALNLDTAAQFSDANGPCGGTACFPAASVSCTSATLSRNRQVLGMLVGASSFDIGHIGVGAGGGGVASLGSVGGNSKAQGCTGLPQPVGDVFAVDYVAHEMGHQFAGNHTFNGTVGSCSGGNRSAANSVEPGSGSSIMAYAGICGTDNLQPHSDPYWSQRSFDEITTFVGSAESNINEVQYAAIRSFNTDGQQFVLRFNGVDSAPIVRGTNFTTAGVKAAIEAITGWPAGGTVTISTLVDTAFTITFGGTLAGLDVDNLQFLNCTGSCTGFVGEVAKGGLTTRGGSVTSTGNNAPTVAVAAASYTIPLRTPFALAGSGSDADDDALSYLWEQADRGASTGTGLVNNAKIDGPLFRQFGVRADVSASDSLLYNSPGENAAGSNPTRVFPDMPQILANETNAESGNCSSLTGVPQVNCYSEFLPTASYLGFAGVNAEPSLNFKLTVRDGRGGVANATTKLFLAPGTGPFLVTSPNAGGTLEAGSPVTVTWSVAGTDVAPISTSQVKISLSADGGLTYPYVMAAATPNDGTQDVTVPLVSTTTARIKVEAVDNIFFDVSNVDLTVVMTQAAQTISFTSLPPLASFGGATYTPTANATSGLAVSFTIDASSSSVCSISGGVVSFIGAGTCLINADQAGDTSWLPAPQVQQSFTVGQAAQGITFANPGTQFFGTSPTLTATADSGLTVSFTSYTPLVCSITSGGVLTFLDVGTCGINADQAGNANYLPAVTISRSFSVFPGMQTIDFPQPADPVFGTTPTLVASASSGLAVTFTANFALCNVTPTGTLSFDPSVINCSITVSQGGDARYLPATSVTRIFNVSKADQTITFPNPGTQTYGSSPALTATASSGLTVAYSSGSPLVCTPFGNAVLINGVGTCVIHADQLGNMNYNAAPQESVSFDVVAASQAITFTSNVPPGAIVGGSTYTPTATGGASGNPVVFTIEASSSSVCAISGGTVSFIGVGTCTINANQAGTANYDAAPQVQQSISVAPAVASPQTITFANPGAQTIGTTPTLSATASSGLAVVFTSITPGVCTITVGGTLAFITTGTCTINANQPGNASYSAAPQVQRSFAVNPVSGQTLTITDETTKEGGATTGKVLTFKVKLPRVATSPVTVNITTVNGSAVAGSDFVAKSQTGLTIPTGSSSATFVVAVIGDTVAESTESFTVVISSASGATILDNTGVGTITDDDLAAKSTTVAYLPLALETRMDADTLARHLDEAMGLLCSADAPAIAVLPGMTDEAREALEDTLALGTDCAPYALHQTAGSHTLWLVDAMRATATVRSEPGANWLDAQPYDTSSRGLSLMSPEAATKRELARSLRQWQQANPDQALVVMGQLGEQEQRALRRLDLVELDKTSESPEASRTLLNRILATPGRARLLRGEDETDAKAINDEHGPMLLIIEP